MSLISVCAVWGLADDLLEESPMGSTAVRAFRRWPEPMQNLMAWVVVALFAAVLVQCLADMVGGKGW